MRAEILCVGSELLLGQIIDTNAAYIGQQLARAGIDLHRKQTAGDNLERIIDCIQGALSRADALIITGGLGPTTDDLTREAIAGALGVELEHHPELEAELREFFAKRNYKPGETIMRQAYLPATTIAIDNPVGTAPGVRYEHEGKFIFAIPGVPKEMRAMLDQTIIPALLAKMDGAPSVIVSRVLRAFGIGESALAEPIEDILTTSNNPTVAPLIFGNTEVHLRLTAKAPDENAAKKLLDDMEARLRERVGEHIFGRDDETMASVVVNLLRQRGLTLGVAESLTGGLLGSMITDVAGASEIFKGGITTYSNDWKIENLDVLPALLDQEGAVSASVAEAMADAIRERGADIGISTTGEAGPQSQSGQKVGTVFIGLSDKSGARSSQREFFGDRDLIRKRAALTALDTLRRHLLAT